MGSGSWQKEEVHRNDDPVGENFRLTVTNTDKVIKVGFNLPKNNVPRIELRLKYSE